MIRTENINKNMGLIKFILDSGASDHFINDMSLFSENESLQNHIAIEIEKRGEYIHATDNAEKCAWARKIGSCKCRRILRDKTKQTI